MAVAQCKEGTTGYSTGTWTPADLVSINRLQRFDGVHLVPVSQVTPILINMDTGTTNLDISSGSVTSKTTFSGTDLGLSSTNNPVTQFSKVIQYSPAGAANVIVSLSGSSTVPPYVQLVLVPTNGSAVVSPMGDCAGFQVDGLTGVSRVFQPGKL